MRHPNAYVFAKTVHKILIDKNIMTEEEFDSIYNELDNKLWIEQTMICEEPKNIPWYIKIFK